MRIGIVTQSFPPARGGVAEHAWHTARELQRRGHRVTVITSRFTPFDEDYGLDVRRIGYDLTLPANGAFVNLTVGFALRRRLRQIEVECRFDVVHIHSPLEPILPLLALRTLAAPKVGTFHTYVSSGKVWPYDVFRGFVSASFRRLAGFVAVSEAAERFIAGYFPGDYTIIPNGVDVSRFSPEQAALARFRSPDFKVLFVGRIDPRKGLRYLLQAFPILYQQVPAIRFIVVGSGILRGYYERFLPRVFRPRVHFEGFVSPEDLPRYYASADVFCAPALGGESFGIVLLEALATGLPVVASNIAGYNSVITDGRDGFLVPAKDSLAIAEALAKLQGNSALRQAMGSRGREKALGYSWERVTGDLEKVYEKACAAK